MGAAAGARLSWEREQLGRVTKEYQNGYEVKSSYDKLGLHDRITSSLGLDVRIKRDKLGNVDSISAKEGDRKAREANFGRDRLGLEIERSLPGQALGLYA